MAAFVMLDFNQIAERRAIIGFGGKILIEETLREKKTDDFQPAEYFMDHGMVDAVVPRAEQPEYIGRLLDFMMGSKDSRKRA